MSLSRILVLVIIFMLPGCGQLSYYSQAAKGQWEIISKREKIPSVLAKSDQDSGLKQKLRLIQEIREFAIVHLKLPENRSFQYYADLDREYVVWNVIATPAFDINPKTWCFPIVGCISYRGYFAEAEARAYEKNLAEQGYDTFLYGVSAYSTLGWFSDPVLNTFLRYDEISLAGLIFHELAHQTVYVKDDTEFNEAFATAVEYTGLEKWINHKYDQETFNRYHEEQKYNDEITEMILDFRIQLENLYANATEFDLSKQKRAIFEQMRINYAVLRNNGKATPFYNWWFELDLNNAHLSTVAAYYKLVPVFLNLFRGSEGFSDFYETVRELGKLPKEDRSRWLSRVQQQ